MNVAAVEKEVGGAESCATPVLHPGGVCALCIGEHVRVVL